MDEVILENRGDIGLVRLNRPSRANSVTPDTVTRLGDAVQEFLRADSVRAIVLTGTGRAFCAGADVKDMHDHYERSGIDGLCDYLADLWMPAVQRTVRKIWAADKPIVAACNGAATAGGLDFALACDARVAAESARFGESYINLGMVPVAGGAYLLPRAIGAAAALELLVSGELVGAVRAKQLGIVGEVCPDDQVVEHAVTLARKLSTAPAVSFRALKSLTRMTTAQFDQVLEASYRADVELIRLPQVRERLVAVMTAHSAPR